MSIVVTLSEEDAKALDAAARAARLAKERFDLEVARARVPLLEAALAGSEVIERLAGVHGFEADKPFTFDAKTRELKQELNHGTGGQAHGSSVAS